MKTPALILALLLLFGSVNAQYHFIYDSAINDYQVYADTFKSISKVDTFKCMVGYQGLDRERFVDGFSVHGHYLTWTGKKWTRTDKVAYLDGNLKLVTAKILHHVDAAGALRGYRVHNDSADFKRYKFIEDPCVLDSVLIHNKIKGL